MVLRNPADTFDAIQHVAVAVREVQFRGRPGRHSGFIYRIDGGPLRFVHLEWHHRLRESSPSPHDLWQELGLDEPNRKFLAAWMIGLGQNSTNIPYGFDPSGSCFDLATGMYRSPPPGKGLTCATFISGVLNSLGYDVVQEHTWPMRVTDIEWQTLIIQALEDTGASRAHIDAILDDIPSIRLRPEEIVAAATLDEAGWPSSFDVVEPMGRQVLAEIAAAAAR